MSHSPIWIRCWRCQSGWTAVGWGWSTSWGWGEDSAAAAAATVSSPLQTGSQTLKALMMPTLKAQISSLGEYGCTQTMWFRTLCRLLTTGRRSASFTSWFACLTACNVCSQFESPTWVDDGGDCDFVVGFACAEACHDILDPPQLFPDLGFLLLKHRDTSKRSPSRQFKSLHLVRSSVRVAVTPTWVRSTRFMWACSADRSQSTSLSSRVYSFHAFSISCGTEPRVCYMATPCEAPNH